MYVFGRITRAGAASAPTGKGRGKGYGNGTEISNFRFEILGNGKGERKFKNPKRRYGVRLGGGTRKSETKCQWRGRSPTLPLRVDGLDWDVRLHLLTSGAASGAPTKRTAAADAR